MAETETEINEPCLSQCPSRKYYFVVV
ncbi:hypothetical protein BROOK1789B_1959, partial [Bathymodiolus brooksi thiotrophic gill symbiont]